MILVGSKMTKLMDWLRANKFKVHLSAFLLMILSAIGMFLAANNDVIGIIWALLGVVVFANIVVILTR